jgi:SAM-dependent methyltransferase
VRTLDFGVSVATDEDLVRRRSQWDGRPDSVLRRDWSGRPSGQMKGEKSAAYVLGGSEDELRRLRAQAAEHEASARQLLEAVGMAPGWRVLDVGCGPIGILPLLAEAVGPGGEAIGLEREPRFVRMARAELTRLGLTNVTVVEGDALSSGLKVGSFDVVHERLVMVNMPERAELVRTMAALAAPGGIVALQDIDNVSWTCEPGHDSWTALLNVFHDVFRAGGGDPFVGRRLPGLARQAGVLDVQTRVTAALPGTTEYRRTHLLSLIDSIHDKIISSGAMEEDELQRHRTALIDHLTDPRTLVIDKLLIQCWGHTRN